MSHQQLDDLKWSPSLFAVFCQLASMGCFFSPFCCHVRIAHTQVQLPPHFMVDFGYVEALRPRFCVAKQLKVPHSKMAVRPYQVHTIWGVPAGLLGFGRRVRFIGQKKTHDIYGVEFITPIWWYGHCFGTTLVGNLQDELPRSLPFRILIVTLQLLSLLVMPWVCIVISQVLLVDSIAVSFLFLYSIPTRHACRLLCNCFFAASLCRSIFSVFSVLCLISLCHCFCWSWSCIPLFVFFCPMFCLEI